MKRNDEIRCVCRGFFGCLAKGVAPENGIEEGARLQELMARAMTSAKEGRWVDTSDLV